MKEQFFQLFSFCFTQMVSLSQVLNIDITVSILAWKPKIGIILD